ncbi:hypothetical protein BIV60_05620 [Bacillus sp. MUM 116]|uniref:hypothetical protein n=1 Tax=Bacillus sp. MUM 116 TaxID=1678002 RepID=UPI0008F562C3|nr:hypothetical protein [Bacillus sp. MUM 116]OIK16253.1 hypothetical protein BIV60_05620 [Bacillus sp. MUM 116]
MYYNPFQYPISPPVPAYPDYFTNETAPRTYPAVDIKIFSHSVNSFRHLMEQGNILLNRLGNASFAHRLMTAAQQGKKAEVDQIIKSIGLKVPVFTKFTPSWVIFELSNPATAQTPMGCCTLIFYMKWAT